MLTGIRSHGRGSKRRTLYLDGEPWVSMPLEAVRELGLRLEDEIAPDETLEQLATLAPRLARERCLRLLAVRERTAAELGGRLRDDGYTQDVTDETVARLVETGLVDDVRFAESMARALVVSRGLGRQRAQRELERRGVPEQLASETLDAHAPREVERERAALAARRLLRATDTVPRLASRLVRRGFAPADALAAARDIVPAHGDEEGLEDY